MKTLHPFERVFSESGRYKKPHVFMRGGRWYRLDVPCTEHYSNRHMLVGQWVRYVLNADARGPSHVDVDDVPAKHAIARRRARHHGGTAS